MLKKIASNTIAQIISKIGTALISIVLIGILTNYLTVELFGTYNKVYNYIYIFSFLVDLGLYAITIKEISANKKNTSYIFGNILTLRLLTGLFVIIAAPTIAYFLPGYNSSIIIESIIILGFFALFSLINSSMLALMQAYMKIEYSLFSVITGKLVILGLVVYITKNLFTNPHIYGYNKPFLAIMLAGMIGIAINAFLNYLYARKITHIKLFFDWKYIKHIFFTSLPYGLALFLSVVYTKIDIVLLSLVEHGAIAERSIALYSLPLKIMDVFMMMGAFLLNSLLPSLSEAYKEKKLDKIQNISQNTFKLLFAFGVGIISLGIVFKNYIVNLIANPNYLEVTPLNQYTSADAFNIVFFMLLFFYLGLVFSYLLVATERQNRLLKISIILTLVNIIGNILLIPKFSFVGAGLVTVFTQIIFLILTYYYSKDIIKFKFPVKFMFIVSIIGIFIYFISYFLITKLSLGGYYNLIYGFGIFGIYSYILGYREYKEIKKA